MIATPKLTPSELARCVTLLGCGYTVAQAIERIMAERPTPLRRTA